MKSHRKGRKRIAQQRIHDWEKVRMAYLSWPRDEKPNKAEIMRRFGMAKGTLLKRIKKGNWNEQRRRYWLENDRRIDEKAADRQAEEIARSIDIANAIDVLNGVAIQNVQKEIKVIKDMPESTKEEREAKSTAIIMLFNRDDVMEFLGANVIDKMARLKKFLRGEADSRPDIGAGMTHEEKAAIWAAIARIRRERGDAEG